MSGVKEKMQNGTLSEMHSEDERCCLLQSQINLLITGELFLVVYVDKNKYFIIDL